MNTNGNSDFVITTRSKWIRLGDKVEQFEERPHIVPISKEAIRFMDDYSFTSNNDPPIIGGLYDPISEVENDAGDAWVYAFRFLAMTDREGAAALDMIMSRFKEWVRKNQAKQRKLPRSKLSAAHCRRQNC